MDLSEVLGGCSEVLLEQNVSKGRPETPWAEPERFPREPLHSPGTLPPKEALSVLSYPMRASDSPGWLAIFINYTTFELLRSIL